MRTRHSPYKIQPRENNKMLSEEMGVKLEALPRFHGHAGKPLRAQSASARQSAGQRNYSNSMSGTLKQRPATRQAPSGNSGGVGGGVIQVEKPVELPALGQTVQ